MSDQDCLKADPQICVQIFEGKFPRETRKVVGGVWGAGRGRSQVRVQYTAAQRVGFACPAGRLINSVNQVSELSGPEAKKLGFSHSHIHQLLGMQSQAL